MVAIIGIYGREILDSRGNPTVEVDVILEDGSRGRAAVPSGASTGSHEAFELRDENASRYHGKGVLKAISSINNEIADAIVGMNSLEQRIIDHALIELDNTENKSRLGANSILAVSLAVAKAAALSCNLPLYKYIGGVNSHILPAPLMNIINGGAHADNSIDIQEFMIMPITASNMAESIRMGAEIFHCLKDLLKKNGYNVNIGDEGGFAPELKHTEQALDLIMQAIEKANYKPGTDIYLALDVAASEFYDNGIYNLKGANKKLNNIELIEFYKGLIKNYPIFSLEDAMAENDETGWQALTLEVGHNIQLVGDDLFVTNPKILKKGIERNLANSVLIKPNQIGTLTETLDTIEIAHKAGYKTILSHRSGETEDTSIAHLAVASNCGQIKTGSLSRTDRLVKYNELIRIEEELSRAGKYAGSLINLSFN